MPKILKTTGLVGLLLLIATMSCWAALPKPVGYVNDFARVIDGGSATAITELATALKEDQGVELAVVTIESSKPLTPKGYATELFNEWGIGGPEDSGLLILLVMGEREIQVEVGYGLEGVLPDGKVGSILDKAVIPYFAKGEWGKGLLEGTRAFGTALAGESYDTRKSKEDEFLGSLIIFLIIVVGIYVAYRRETKGAKGTVFRTGPVHPGTMRLPRSSGGPKRGGGGFGGFGGGRSGGGGAGRKF